jgi:hypothetical protein
MAPHRIMTGRSTLLDFHAAAKGGGGQGGGPTSPPPRLHKGRGSHLLHYPLAHCLSLSPSIRVRARHHTHTVVLLESRFRSSIYDVSGDLLFMMLRRTGARGRSIHRTCVELRRCCKLEHFISCTPTRS